MKSSVAFHTLGCRLNQSETAAIENSFDVHGYRVLKDEKQQADIVVINTCTVTNGGDADTRRLVHKIARQNPQVRIALVGCQAQVQKHRLSSLPNVRWIVGNQRKMDLVDVIAQQPDPTATQVITPVIERKAFVQQVAAVDRQHTRANIKIQDGCDFFCSFCEIPYARGRARSRVFEDIGREAEALAQAGHQEVIVTGINVGTYAYEGKTISDVLDALQGVAGIRRVRISSIEPTTVPQDWLARMRQGRLCRHLHLPLQSGCDEILVDMKRKYTVAEFDAFIVQAQALVPGICLGTDIIVGYPGETDTQFNATFDYLRESPVHYIHVFSYYPRQNAQKRISKQAATQVISSRSRQLRELSRRKIRLFYESLVGSTQMVLMEHMKDGHWWGYTDNFVRVKVKSSRSLHNTFIEAKILSADEHGALGVCL